MMSVYLKPLLLFAAVSVFSCGYLEEHLKNLSGGISQSPSVTPPTDNSLKKMFSQIGAGAGKDFKVQNYSVNATGELYFTATTTSTLAFGEQYGTIGPEDAVFGKISRQGTIEWLKRFGASGVNCGYYFPNLVFGDTGDIYATFTCGDMGFQELSPSGVGFNTQVILRVNTNGAVKWARQISTDYDSALSEPIFSPMEPGKFYLTGTSQRDMGGTKLGNCSISGRYVAKMDVDGSLNWVSQHCQTGSPTRASIIFDSSGNPIIAGGVGSWFNAFTLSYGSSGAQWMTGLAKFASSNGNIDYVVKHITSSSTASINLSQILSDLSGNAVVVSGIYGNATNGGSLTGTGSSGTRAVINLHGSAGTRTWAREFAAGGSTWTSIDWIKNVSGAGGGDFLIAGSTSGTITCGTCTNIGTASSTNAFVARLTNTGTVTWLRNLGGIEPVKFTSDSSENLFVLGNTGTTHFPGALQIGTSGLQDLAVIKIASNGTVTWSTEFGGGAGKVTKEFWAYTHTPFLLNSDGSMFVTGITDGTLAPSASVVGRSSPNQRFIAKLNPSGLLTWGTQVGGDMNYNASIKELSDGSLVLMSMTASLTSNTQVGSLGTKDISLSRFSSLGTLITDYQVGAGPGLSLGWGDPNGWNWVNPRMDLTENWLTFPLRITGGALSDKPFFFGSPGTTGAVFIRHDFNIPP